MGLTPSGLRKERLSGSYADVWCRPDTILLPLQSYVVGGLKIRIAALGAGVLISLFALSMSNAYGVKRAMDYSVFIGSAEGFVLASFPEYRFSLDALLKTTVRSGASKENFARA
jgi:hypothetical protein